MEECTILSQKAARYSLKNKLKDDCIITARGMFTKRCVKTGLKLSKK